ncbi:hypothetical protein M947_00170 [Sulfurimonas hongkongensis]|uniref:TMEM205-like domain-containing protein n=1 Tax=Sulfurimonas hongkongensis TaxID=1172190 RepID=T0KUR4_9BACT|nr:DUF4149 domain-containing protein [Sulfurimonas hongkongensis]EQB40699.1 hypothetical protein M947_00170 [Sulfurimonas hongkongensis]
MRKRIYVDFSYLVILAATFGAVIVLGAVAAPVVFNPNKILVGISIDHFNSGIIMGEIFRRFSYWIYFIATVVIIYESVMYKLGQRDAIVFASSVTVVFSSLMFSAVYLPKILSMQAIGIEATQSDTFRNVHIASELDFKILAVGLLVLFIRRLLLLRFT